jgi:hypothetical protein
MTDPLDEDTIPVRRTGMGGSDPVTEPVDGSTVIAHRESRRRAAREQASADHPAPTSHPAPPAPAPAGRVAAAPGAASDSVYSARVAAPVVATRAAPPERVPQVPVDGAAASATQRRRARRTALIVVIAASAVAFGSAAWLLAIALTP